MRFIPPQTLRLLAFAVGGLAIAIWLTVFFHDTKRPSTPQERADRLAAENYASGTLTALVPFSAEHWAQRLVLQNPHNDKRHAVARESSALLIAVSAGSPRIASVLAFAVATAALAWLLGGVGGIRSSVYIPLIGLILLALVKGQAWQFVDPTGYLLLTGVTLALGAWLRHRERSCACTARLLALGLGLLLLTEPTCALIGTVAIALDFWRLRQGSPIANARKLEAYLGQTALILFILLGLLTIRNQVVLGTPFQSPREAYAERNVTAPEWFWQTTRAPQPDLDFVIERYDELVALPSARFETPGYQTWLTRVNDGLHYTCGLGVALAALVALLLNPNRIARVGSCLIIGTTTMMLLRYPVTSAWWMLTTPPLALLAAHGLESLTRWQPRGAKRALLTIALLQVSLLATGPSERPHPAEYAYADQIRETEKKIQETAGGHLVFVRFDHSSDARIEPADLPRIWKNRVVLYARELGPEKDAALVTAMPERTPWRIIVFRDRIGLQRWSPASAPGTKPTDTDSTPATTSEAITPPTSEPTPPVGGD